MMLFLTVSLTIHGFCVTKLNLPLMITLGLSLLVLNFISPNKAYRVDDFPDPISPMMATHSPFLMLKFRSVKWVELSAIDSYEVSDRSQ